MGVAGGLSLSAKYFLLKQESVSYRSRACLFWLVRVPRKLFVLGIGQTSVLLCQHFSKHFSTVGACLTNKNLSWRNSAFRTSSLQPWNNCFSKKCIAGAKIRSTKMSQRDLFFGFVYTVIRIIMRAISTFLGNDATVAVVWRFLKPIGNVHWHKS